VYCAFVSGAAIVNRVNASIVEISDCDVLKALPPFDCRNPKIRATPVRRLKIPPLRRQFVKGLQKDKDLKTKDRDKDEAENPCTEGWQVNQGWQLGMISACQLAKHLYIHYRSWVSGQNV
jgi:hypothetical protein